MCLSVQMLARIKRRSQKSSRGAGAENSLSFPFPLTFLCLSLLSFTLCLPMRLSPHGMGPHSLSHSRTHAHTLAHFRSNSRATTLPLASLTLTSFPFQRSASVSVSDSKGRQRAAGASEAMQSLLSTLACTCVRLACCTSVSLFTRCCLHHASSCIEHASE